MAADNPRGKLLGESDSVQSKPVQEQFGQAVIDALVKFARSDLKSVPELQAYFFDHVTEQTLQRELAETLYGARWIYKLGLALLVTDVEQSAHIHAQIFGYGSVCEALLRDRIDHALSRGIMIGDRYMYADPQKRQRRYRNVPLKLRRQSFHWVIVVALDEHIITDDLAKKLQRLRVDRNRVHVHARSHKTFLSRSRQAFETAYETAAQTRRWKPSNP